MKRFTFGWLWIGSLLWITPVQAQLSVNVGGDGSVQVHSNGTNAAVPGVSSNVYSSGNTNTSIQRSYHYQNGRGSSSTYQYQNNGSASDSYQYRSDQGISSIDVDAEDLDDTPAYLMLNAPFGKRMYGSLRINGHNIPILNRSNLILPLSGLLHPGINRIELSGASIAETEIILDDDRPTFSHGQPFGSFQTLFQSSGLPNQTLILNIH